ncbi:Translation initiation factor IF-2 [Frankliniella fusca]|uniref:Translation initiation factor IF-2 n=1 Tax=Frankliniella fusca TaxID=407009 RepID=A0AAE1LLZ8_9NEOP|nr:Translation initiation factor IF-2 [Frankliniella fusca]
MDLLNSKALWIWMAMLIVIKGRVTANQPVTVTQTKGVLINLAESKVAMGSLQLSFNINLPSVNLAIKINDSVCSPSLSAPTFNACRSLLHIDKMSHKILLELQTIFKRSESLDQIVPKRTKRAMLPILGRVLNWVTGVATEQQLNKVINNVNQLAQGVQDLAASHSNLIKATNQNVESLSNHQKDIENNMNFFVDRFNKLVDVIGKFESDFDVAMFKIAGTATIMNKINILQTHLLSIKSIHEKCQDNLLPKIVVPEESLRQALKAQKEILDEHALELIFDDDSFSTYYSMETAKCVLVKNESMQITFDVPLKDSRANFFVMDIVPIKFLLHGRTCQIVKETVRIATDGITIRDLTNSPKLGQLDIYVLPRENSQSAISTCVHKLLTHADVDTIASACDLHCVDTLQSTAQAIGTNKFSILNPSAPLAIICGSNLVKNLPTLENGRYDVTVPCHCSVQETVGMQEILISAIRTCSLNLGLNSSVSINMDWAGESFEPYELFATERDISELKLNNVTLPELKLVQVDDFKSNALSTWRSIPVYSSGWVEIFLWILIIFVTLCIGYCYLRYNFPWMVLGLCQNKDESAATKEGLVILGTESFRGIRRPTIKARKVEKPKVEKAIKEVNNKENEASTDETNEVLM